MQSFGEAPERAKPPHRGLVLIYCLSPTESRPWIEGALRCEADAQRVATLADCESLARHEAAQAIVLVSALEAISPRFLDRTDAAFGSASVIVLKDDVQAEPWIQPLSWDTASRAMEPETSAAKLDVALAEAAKRREENRQVLDYHRREELLSSDEREVFDAVCAGRLNKQIANEMLVSVRTIEQRRRRVFQKMGVESAVPLAKMRATVETLESQWRRLRRMQPLDLELAGPPAPHMNVASRQRAITGLDSRPT